MPIFGKNGLETLIYDKSDTFFTPVIFICRNFYLFKILYRVIEKCVKMCQNETFTKIRGKEDKFWILLRFIHGKPKIIVKIAMWGQLKFV